jgi:hypothetical protein
MYICNGVEGWINRLTAQRRGCRTARPRWVHVSDHGLCYVSPNSCSKCASFTPIAKILCIKARDAGNVLTTIALALILESVMDPVAVCC